MKETNEHKNNPKSMMLSSTSIFMIIQSVIYTSHQNNKPLIQSPHISS